MDDLRKEVDKCDKKIIILISNRMNLSKKIAMQKKKLGLKIIDAKREAKILRNCVAQGKKFGLEAAFVKKVFNEIIFESRRVQNKKTSKNR